MTQDEIIQMARQAGLVFDAQKPELSVYPPALEAFAQLVAAKQREACAKVCDNKQYVHPYHDLGTLIRAMGNT